MWKPLFTNVLSIKSLLQLYLLSIEQFAFEIALTSREGSATQNVVDFGKNHVFSQNDSY